METKKIVLVDLDGTVSVVGDRLKFIRQKPKDWDAFYAGCLEDEPKRVILDLVRVLASNYRIAFCTGRREGVRQATVEWLVKYLDAELAKSAQLLMRKDGDFRNDSLVKPELVAQAGIEKDEIAFVLEDRDSMVATWREMGLTCLQVAPGPF